MNQKPKCINCGRRKSVEAVADGMFRCTHCRILFDSDPDEGGTHSTGNPAGRLERQEGRRERQQDRIGRR